MEDMRYLTFALGKGRLAKKTLELFEKIGITCEEMKDKDTRKLIFVNEELKLRFFLAKGPDVPTYVRIRCRGHRHCREGYHIGGRAQYLRSLRPRIRKNVGCASADRRMRKNSLKAP